MRRTIPYLILFLNSLLLVLVIFHDNLSLPGLIQAGGRLHPLLLHLPIGLMLIAALVWFRRKQFGEETTARMLPVLLGLNALLTALSALAGVALSTEVGYDGIVLYRHMNLGTALSIITALQYSWYTSDRLKTKGFSVLTAIGVMALVYTGHLGSVITHGEGFLTGGFGSADAAETAAASDSITVFEAAILPVLNRKCNSCHNPGKKKGELLMTTLEGIMAGGENGPVWMPGKPEESSLIKRIHLPLDHDDHMPPAGKPQPTRAEMKLLELFIRSGADGRKTLASLPETDSLRILAASEVQRQAAKKISGRKRPFGFVASDEIKALNNPVRTVTQISADDPGIEVGFHLAAGFTTASVEELEPIAANVVSIDLTGMPVTKETAAALDQFPNLERLNLTGTGADNDCAKVLSELPSIRSLSLAGTRIGVEGLKLIASNKTLRVVHVWGTPHTEAELETLRKMSDAIEWDEGFIPDPDEILKLTPPLVANENRILASGEKIVLKHNLPGVEIRYTTDAKIYPDSVTGDIYKAPLPVTGYTMIRSRAVKPGWVSSTTSEFYFFTAGIKPATARLLTPPAKDYRASGANTLTDVRGGDADNHRDGQWLGYRESPLVTEFDLGAAKSIGSISVSYLKNIGSYIMPPQSVEVMAAEKPGQWKTIGKSLPVQPGKYDPNRVEAALVNGGGKYRYWKVTITPVPKLPRWHSGKGEKGWIMVDEVFFFPPTQP